MSKKYLSIDELVRTKGGDYESITMDGRMGKLPFYVNTDCSKLYVDDETILPVGPYKIDISSLYFILKGKPIGVLYIATKNSMCRYTLHTPFLFKETDLFVLESDFEMLQKEK